MLMLAVHLAHVTKRLKIGCGFNIAPMWHPLRLAEDYAVADILTKGRTVFGVGRGYHTREVETFGARCRTRRQPRAVRGAGRDHVQGLQQRALLAQGQVLHAAAGVPYRGYKLEELTLVPRPVNRPVECWQPIVSATPRAGLHGAARHQGRRGRRRRDDGRGPDPGLPRCRGACRQELEARREPHGRHLLLYRRQTARRRSARSRRTTKSTSRCSRRWASCPASRPSRSPPPQRRGGWDAAGVPTLEHYMKMGSWFAGTSADLVEHLKKLEARYPGMEHINLSHQPVHAQGRDAGAVPARRRGGHARVQGHAFHGRRSKRKVIRCAYSSYHVFLVCWTLPTSHPDPAISTKISLGRGCAQTCRMGLWPRNPRFVVICSVRGGQELRARASPTPRSSSASSRPTAGRCRASRCRTRPASPSST